MSSRSSPSTANDLPEPSATLCWFRRKPRSPSLSTPTTPAGGRCTATCSTIWKPECSPQFATSERCGTGIFLANIRQFPKQMGYSVITLYQFQFSHFCEKIRWALDFKGPPYKTKNLMPGLHIKVSQKLAPKSCLPIVDYDGTIVQDSTAIISFLDKKSPAYPLTPSNARQ